MLFSFHFAERGTLVLSRRVQVHLHAATRGAHSLSMVVPDPEHERRLLLGVLNQDLVLQDRKQAALEQQLQVGLPVADRGQDEAKLTKAYEKALRRAQQVPGRLADVDSRQSLVRDLLQRVRERGADLTALRASVADDLGLAGRLESFDVESMNRRQFGRPDGFDGLVIESPRGIPILVARQTFRDSLLRRVARGNDLWFQVHERRGSRVLLRTSMVRHLARSPRQCMEMAADLAVYFSDWRRCRGEVEVMYTDSKHVAKRGTRVGQMKRSKSLGLLWGSPERVVDVAAEAQEAQGWL
jgi:hypothetical protein